MSMSVDGFIAAPNDEPGNPDGDNFMVADRDLELDILKEITRKKW
jgi:hypothetical protein